MRRSLLLIFFGFGVLADLALGQVGMAQVEKKLASIVIPKIEIVDATLADALDIVRARAKEFDVDEADPLMKGVRIGYERMHSEEPVRVISLKVENVTLGMVLEDIGGQADRRIEIYRDGVSLIKNLGGISDDLFAVRSYRVPPHFISLDTDLDDPFDINEDKLKERDGHAAKKILENVGVMFPEGAEVWFDLDKATLTVKNTRKNLVIVEMYVGVGAPTYHFGMRIDTEIYSVPSLLARDLTRGAARGRGALRLRGQIEAALREGEAELFAMPSVVTRSGQRAKTEDGVQVRGLNKVSLKDGVETFEFYDEFFGNTLEVDPVLGADNRTIELYLALELALKEAAFEEKVVEAPASGQIARVEVPRFERAALTLATTLMNGQPQFLGVLSGGSHKEGKALVVFVTAFASEVGYELPLPE